MVWVSVGIMFWMAVKKIVDEKSSFGNGWRFFILQKVREAGCDGKTSDRAVEGGGVKGERGAVGYWRKYVRRCLTGQCRQEGC